MRQDEESEYREGVVVDRPSKAGHGSLVNCGMKKVGVGRWVVVHLGTLVSYERQAQAHK